MEWIKASVSTASKGIEPLTGRLYGIGITGVEIEDTEDYKRFLEQHKQYWDYIDEGLLDKKNDVRVIFYVSKNAFGLETLVLARETIAALKELDTNGEFGSLEISLESINEEDWAENWKKYFKTMPVGEKILIRPEWEQAADGGGRTVFVVNPGMTFGTGTHESTRMCICALETYIKEGTRVLDLGCGSGILSVISLLLGAKSAVAVDIDPNCEKVAYENALRNGIKKDDYTVYSGNIITDDELKSKIGGGFDIVVANIVADVIIAIAPDIKQYLKNDGVFICSGIIDFREAQTAKALLDSGLEIINIRREGEWSAIAAKLCQELKSSSS
ncbi:MAG: Ribosomal protein L11 methyltransferase [Firmicutes bacterium ADurb.Bin193]|nr:MAG: Ribosomal protein L11 methyltransferase [Firmicutes bacterium ADurb.Bin193]